ncbi:MAG: hypothetical protein JWQ97_914 [Phenylobacterium sp.]|nr:hypothetical protein [Phenylobacterium sp.]
MSGDFAWAGFKRRLFWATALCATAAAAVAGPAAAAPYDLPQMGTAPPPPAGPPLFIAPYVGLQETYTDNANLTSNQRQSDFITRGLAGAAVTFNSGPFAGTVNAHYAYDWYARTNRLNGGSLFTNGGATYTIMPGRLWIEADGTVTNGYTTTFGQSAVDRSGTQGRAQVAVYRVGPQVATTLGDVADIGAAARYMQVFFSEADGSTVPLLPSNDNIVQVVGRADTGNRHAGVQLLTTAQFERDNNGFRTGNAVESVFVRLTPGLRAIARAGYERVYQAGVTDVHSPLLSAGLEFRLNDQSTFSLEGGERYNHTAWSADADIEFGQKLSLKGYYRETLAPDQFFVASSFSEFVAQTAVLPPPIVPTTLTPEENAYNETSLNKAAQANLVFQTAVHAVSISTRWSDRHFLRSNTHDRSLIGSVSYSRRLRPDLDFSADASFARTYASPIYGKSENYGGSVSLYYWLNAKATIQGTYSHREGRRLVVGGEHLSENVLLVAIEKRF